MGEYVIVKDLPASIQAALASVGYHGKDISVEASETVTLSSSGGSGSRAFVTLVNLTSGQHVTHLGSWGGPNTFDRSNPVDNDTNRYALPADGVAITGSQGGAHPVYATLRVPVSMVQRILPSNKVELTQVEKDALYCHKSIKGGAYRRDELSRRRVPSTVVDDLVARGLLSRNKAGAVSITTDGKNAVGNYRGY